MIKKLLILSILLVHSACYAVSVVNIGNSKCFPANEIKSIEKSTGIGFYNIQVHAGYKNYLIEFTDKQKRDYAYESAIKQWKNAE